jgi:hypothetical protein
VREACTKVGSLSRQQTAGKQKVESRQQKEDRQQEESRQQTTDKQEAKSRQRTEGRDQTGDRHLGDGEGIAEQSEVELDVILEVGAWESTCGYKCDCAWSVCVWGGHERECVCALGRRRWGGGGVYRIGSWGRYVGRGR